MRSFADRRWALLLAILAIFACVMRWYYVANSAVVVPLRGDATQYYSYAWNLIHHGIFSKALPDSAQVAPDSFRDPGFSIFLAGWMKLAGEKGGAWYALFLLGQAFLGGVGAMMAAMLARRVLAPALALSVGLLVAVWPHCITINGDILSETLFGFLVLFALLLIVSALECDSRKLMALAGLCFSFAALTNSIILPFAPLLALWLLWMRGIRKTQAITLLVAAILLPGAWMLRNVGLQDGESSRDRALLNFDQGSWPEYHSAWRKALAEGDEANRHVLDEISREGGLVIASPGQGLAVVGRRMAQDPMKYILWYLFEKPVLLWGWDIKMGEGGIYVYPVANSPFESQVAWRAIAALCCSLNPWLMLAAAYASVLWMIGLWRHRGRQDSPLALDAIALLGIYVTLIYSLLQSEPRYSIPFRPFEFALAVSALSWTASKLQKLRIRSHGGGAVGLRTNRDSARS